MNFITDLLPRTESSPQRNDYLKESALDGFADSETLQTVQRIALATFFILSLAYLKRRSINYMFLDSLFCRKESIDFFYQRKERSILCVHTNTKRSLENHQKTKKHLLNKFKKEDELSPHFEQIKEIFSSASDFYLALSGNAAKQNYQKKIQEAIHTLQERVQKRSLKKETLLKKPQTNSYLQEIDAIRQKFLEQNKRSQAKTLQTFTQLDKALQEGFFPCLRLNELAQTTYAVGDLQEKFMKQQFALMEQKLELERVTLIDEINLFQESEAALIACLVKFKTLICQKFEQKFEQIFLILQKNKEPLYSHTYGQVRGNTFNEECLIPLGKIKKIEIRSDWWIRGLRFVYDSKEEIQGNFYGSEEGKLHVLSLTDNEYVSDIFVGKGLFPKTRGGNPEEGIDSLILGTTKRAWHVYGREDFSEMNGDALRKFICWAAANALALSCRNGHHFLPEPVKKPENSYLASLSGTFEEDRLTSVRFIFLENFSKIKNLSTLERWKAITSLVQKKQEGNPTLKNECAMIKAGLETLISDLAHAAP